ncbi:MAG: ammonia-forming cytochrome c nitrite reductase subunit c552 [Erysipelotrichaceae bacterium]|nr:ammonia-forming cytochrome c nitrite reductase subunit c552 [Erysipelotrichaceae bacterium]
MKKLITALLCLVCGIALGAVAGCGQDNAPDTPTVSVDDKTDEVVVDVTENANGVVAAEQWKEEYPEIYASFVANEENEFVFDHVEEYPMISAVYEGMAFNTYYNAARAHSYSLEDVQNTGRPHALANCLTCKSADYTAIVNKTGLSAYTTDFAEMAAKLEEGISCYNCHGNDVTELVVTHQYLTNAVGEDSGVAIETLTCGQCHVEYYFDKETKAVTLPYGSIEEASPDAILAYFNEMGFADYTNPRTGTQQIKVQHPEFETYTGAGSVHAGQFTCADCHMGNATSEDGTTYVSHTWTSPLNNPELVAQNCASCHADFEGFVKGIQEKAEDRVYEIGYDLEELTNKLAAAVESGQYTEDELNAIRALNRDAQFYWDFVFVENSEGAHNSKLTHDCLDKAEALIEQANGLFK